MSFNAVAYFEQVARKLKAIGHTDDNPRFFRIRSLAGLDELLTNLPQASFPAIMVHDLVDGVLGDFSVSDNYVEEPQTIFYVLQKATFGDEASIDAAISNCRTIGYKIISRMLHHRNTAQHDLDFIDLSSIPFQSVGPLGDQCYGMMYMLSVADHLDLRSNTADWNDNW